MQPRGEQASFGSLLRRYRTSAGLTQEQLAERAGLSRRGIADLERGARSAPYAHTLDQLRSALGLADADDALLLSAARRARSAPQDVSAAGRQGIDTAGPTIPRGLDAERPRHNLPVHPTSFVGRNRERSHLATLLLSCPLVTLIGPGGVGKTRLALEVAAETSDLWPDGVWLIELAPLTDPDLVPQSVAVVLGVYQPPDVDLITSITAWLRSKRMLLIFDNCEHLLSACARFASELLRTCTDVRVLATSRETLGIRGETIWRVDPLPIPDADAFQRVTDSEAVRLFATRAAAAAPGFELTEHNAPAVAQICRQIDGLPLALELAAARLRALSVEEVAARLTRRYDLLTSGSRDALPRHRTLRALIDWSYDLLSDECDLARSLSTLRAVKWLMNRACARRWNLDILLVSDWTCWRTSPGEILLPIYRKWW